MPKDEQRTKRSNERSEITPSGLNVNQYGIDIIKFNNLYDLGTDAFTIDLGAKAPTTNFRDLGADVFRSNIGVP
jgi:hypothetical protein